MHSFTAGVEHDRDADLYIGFVPGLPGENSQEATLDELQQNLREALSMLREDGRAEPESDFVGTQAIRVA